MPSTITAPSLLSGAGRSRSFVRVGAAAGFSLLEVLVAIVVLSFGVLGVVGLQAGALQANKEARYQSSGVRLARELADLMRGNYGVAVQAGNPYLSASYAFPPSAVSQNCYASAGCTTPTAAAQWQVYEWSKRVGVELPSPKVAVCFDKTPYSASGAAQWPCTGDGDVLYVKVGWTRQSTDRSATTADQASKPSVVMPVLPQ